MALDHDQQTFERKDRRDDSDEICQVFCMLMEQYKMKDEELTFENPSPSSRAGDSKFVKTAVSVVLMIPVGMFLLSLWLTRRGRSKSSAAEALSNFDQLKE